MLTTAEWTFTIAGLSILALANTAAAARAKKRMSEAHVHYRLRWASRRRMDE